MQTARQQPTSRTTRLTAIFATALVALAGLALSARSIANEPVPSHPAVSADTAGSLDRFDPLQAFAHIQAWRAEHPLSRNQPHAVTGATHLLGNCNDSGVGSLRWHIGHAVSGDTIDMSNLACFFMLVSPIMIPQQSLTLKGQIQNGLINSIIMPTSSNGAGLLRHTGTGTLTMSHIILNGGKPDSTNVDGACLYSAGSLDISGSIIQDCRAARYSAISGGAIFAAGDVSLTDSVVAGNEVVSTNGLALGAGIFTWGGVNLLNSAVLNNHGHSTNQTSRGGGILARQGASIDKSTIANNSADIVGGVMVTDGGVALTSSTISGNSAENYAAAYFSNDGADILVISSTIADNEVTVGNWSQAAGLGIAGTPSSITLINTIVSGNRDANLQNAQDLYIDTATSLSSANNLIGSAQWSTGGVPVGIHQYDTPLEPLAYNGGPTPTHAIGTGSWAFNMGWSLYLQDQRGMPVGVGTGDDIGAFESDALFIGRFELPYMVED